MNKTNNNKIPNNNHKKVKLKQFQFYYFEGSTLMDIDEELSATSKRKKN